MLAIRICEPSSKRATLKNKRDDYFKTLWKGASTRRPHKRKFICSALCEVVRYRRARTSPISLFGEARRILHYHCTNPRPNRRGFFETRPLQISKPATRRSEEHTSELQSRQYLVC